MAEVWALKEALSWLYDRGFQGVQIKSDCQQIVELIQEEIQPNSYVLSLRIRLPIGCLRQRVLYLVGWKAL
ncbi:conserved hypothetical protein [Ricinus communis]|uniref:RNase H type-1 domain-containing protein n=1 Tax=Ricinus communis TaxID=3988 RepID=B9S3U1_RICCO|nr:conserved hypothetical protein [Ricinus communis]